MIQQSLVNDGPTLIGVRIDDKPGTGTTRRWVTVLELTANGWQTAATRHVLHTALASQPPRHGAVAG